MTTTTYMKPKDLPIVGGGTIFPVKKMSSSCARLPVLSIDAIDGLLEPDNDEMKTVLAWVDEQTFSRPKKHLHRDFSDGVMMAELIHHFLPKYVELHNYIPANAVPAKKNNWRTLNRKVFTKMDFVLSESLIEFLAMSRTGAVELVLRQIYSKIMSIMEARARQAEEMESKNNNSTGKAGMFGMDGPGRDLICKAFGDTPDVILCNGNKFVNEKLLEDKCAKLTVMDQELKELRNKVRRLETLVNLKDERLCVLTMELHQAQQQNAFVGAKKKFHA